MLSCVKRRAELRFIRDVDSTKENYELQFRNSQTSQFTFRKLALCVDYTILSGFNVLSSVQFSIKLLAFLLVSYYHIK